jgi:hypothetical protein
VTTPNTPQPGRQRRGDRERAAADDRLLAALKAAAHDGATTPDITRRLGLSDASVSTCKQRLTRLAEEGRIGWWLDPIGRCGNRRRWWALEFLPTSQPAPSNKRSAGLRDVSEQSHGLGWRTEKRDDGITWCESSKRDYRAQVLPGEAPSVISSAECRPWAMAAAQQIGGAV